MAYVPSNPLYPAPQTESSDIGLAFKKGGKALIGSGSMMFRGMGGDFLRSIGLEEMGENWIGDSYARGILMGMDMKEIEEKMTGPKTLRDIEDWKGAIAWGVNSVAEQTPTLMMQFAPAVAMFALSKNPTGLVGTTLGGRVIGKTSFGKLLQKNPRTATTLTALGTIDFMNTAEVYSQLMMEAGESRPAVAASTGAAMSALDMVVPLKILGKMGHGSTFAGWFGRKLKNPDQKLKRTIAGALESGVMEGSTEYVQTIFENLATAYVKEEDLWESFQKERAMLEQEEAGARGALIGTLLGGGVSFMGARRASKRKAEWLRNFMKDQKELTDQPLLTQDLKMLTAPLDEAMGDKIRDAQGKTFEEFQAATMESEIYDSGFDAYKRDSSLFESILNSKMSKVLKDGEGDILDGLIAKERAKTLLMAQTLVGRGRALTETVPELDPEQILSEERSRATEQDSKPPTYGDAVGVAIPIGKPLTVPAGAGGPFSSWSEIPTATAGIIAEGGFSVSGSQSILTAKGEPAMKRGKPDVSLTYANRSRGITLRKRNQTKVSDWVIIEDSTGDVIDSGTWRELRDKYEGTPVRQEDYAAGDTLTKEEYTQAGFQRRPSRAEFEVAEAQELSEQFERELSRRGELPPGTGDRVTIEMADDFGDWSNVDLRTDKQFDTYVVRSVEERSVPRPGITAPQYAAAKQTVYKVINDRTGNEEELAILPEEEDDLRIVIRQRAAQKKPKTEGRVTLADIEFMDDLLSKEEKAALFPFTQEGEVIAVTNERKENAKRFFGFIQDKPFRKRLGDALEEAFNLRGEKVAQNISKLQHQSKEDIERFIEESGKTKPAIDEDRAGANRPTIETGLGYRTTEEAVIEKREKIADEKLHSREIAATDAAREAKLSGMSKKKRKETEKLETRGIPVLTEEETQQVLDDLAEQIAIEKKASEKEKKKQSTKDTANIRKRLKTKAEGPKETTPKKERPEHLESIPKGKTLLDVIDEEREMPSPETHEVKIKSETAQQKGLNPEFFYTYNTTAPREFGFIIINGQYIRKYDVVEVQEIKGKTTRLKEGDFIRGRARENTLRYKGGPQRGMKATVELPEGIPSPETVRDFWIDNRTGTVIIQREASIDLADIEKMDADYPYDYEVYLTWYNREEHQAKVEELRDRLMPIYERTKGTVSESTTINLEENKKFLVDYLEREALPKIGESRWFTLEVQVKPSVIREVNRERKKLGLAGVPLSAKFRVVKHMVESSEGPIAMHKAEGKKVFPSVGPEGLRTLSRQVKNKIKIVHGGYTRVINLDSATKAYVSREVAERTGVLVPYQSLVEEGPEKGIRLIGSYRGSIQAEANAMEKLMADMFIPKAHAFGKNKEATLERRASQLEEAKGRKVLVEYFDGATIEGQLVDVNREAGTFTVGIPKEKPRPEAKQRFDHVEVDILGYDRIQAEAKPKEVSIAREVSVDNSYVDPINDPDGDNVIHVPIIATPVVDTVRPTATPEGLTRLEIYKTGFGTTQKDTRYVIKVDDMEESPSIGRENFGINQAIAFVNNLVKQTGGMEGIDVVSIPKEIVAETVLVVTKAGEASERVVGFEKRKYTPPASTGRDVWEYGKTTEKYSTPIITAENEAAQVKELDDDIKKITDFVFKSTTAPVVVAEVKPKETVTKPEVTDEQAENFDEVMENTGVILEKGEEITQKDIKKIQADFRGLGLKAPTAAQIREGEVDLTAEAVVPEPETETDTEVVETEVKPAPTTWTMVADDKVLPFEDVKKKTLLEIPEGQTFEDSLGGQWKKVEQIAKTNTMLKFVGGKAPDLKFQVESKGKKDEVPFGPGFLVDADSLSTPHNIFLLSGVEGLKAGQKVAFSYKKGKPIPKFSVVRPTPDGEFGRMDYNTGLTPATFRDIVGKQIGRLTLTRLEKDGVVRIVQNQQDVPNAPLGMGVKAIERNGQVWFITNNMKESEVVGTFYHDVGTHVGLLRVYGDKIFQHILGSARERKDSTPEWKAAFETATKVFNTLHEVPDNLTDKAREQWESVTPEQEEVFITEEAIGYYIEDAPVTDSFWRLLIDWLHRVKANVKKYLGMKMSDAEIVAFIRGAARGTMNRNNERADNRMYEHYSAAFGHNLDRKAYDHIKKKIDQVESFNTKKRLESFNSIRKSVVKFFEPMAYLPFKGWYKQLRSVAQGRMAEFQEKGKKVLDMYKNLSPEENEQLFNFFTTKDANPLDIKNLELRKASVEYKDIIRKIGREAVARGMIKPEQLDQYKELEDAYLPRVLLLHLLSSQNPTSLPTGMTPSMMHWTKERVKLYDEMKEAMQEVKDVNYLVYRAITIPMQDLILVEFLETVSQQSAFNKGQAPWVMPNQWIMVEIDGKKRRRTVASLRREAESWQVLANASTGKKESDAIKKVGELEKIVFEFYKKVGISKDASKEVADAGLEAYYSKELKKADPDFSTKQYKQIPDQPRFGAMAGLWIRKEIYDDVRGNASQFFGEEGIMGKVFSPHGRHAEWVGIFKTVKVPLNPPSVVRNAFSNTLLLQLSGLPFHKQPEYLGMALKMYKGKEGDYKTYAVEVDKRNEDGIRAADAKATKKFADTKESLNAKRKEDREGKTPEEKKAIDKAYRQAVVEADVVRRNTPRETETKMMNGFEIAKHYGVGMTTMRAAELNALEAVIKSMQKDGVHGSMFKAKQAWAKLAAAGGDMYQLLEMVGKVAMIQYKLDNSQSELQEIREANKGPVTKEHPKGTPIDLAYAAVMEANDALFDYSEVSSAVRGIRSSFLGAPFITFQVKVIPKMLKTMARHPMRFLPYVGFYMAAQAAFGSIPFEDDEWDEFRALMPDWIKETGHGMLWPFKDSEGRVLAFDASWMVPWGGLTNAVMDMGRGNPVQGLQSVGLIPPGFQWASAILTNEDHFTKREVYDEKGSSSDQGFDILSYAWAQAMPPWLSDRGFIGGSSLIEALARLDPSMVEGRIIDAIGGRTNRYGEPKKDIVTSFLYLIGLNMYPISKNERSIRMKRFNSERQELQGDITKTRQDKSLSKSQKSRKIEEFRRRIDEAREEKKEFAAATS